MKNHMGVGPKSNKKRALRIKRSFRVRKKISGNPDKPRISIFRSTKHIYAQIIDDNEGKTLVASSSLSKAFKEQMKTGGNLKAAALVGAMIGEQAAAKGIKEVYCDRNGFHYSGRIKALADAVREKGIKF